MRRAGEDYMQAILAIEKAQDRKGVRITDIAEYLSVSKPSTNRMMKRLREEGCIEQESYGDIYLSRKGRAFAEDVAFRHTTLVRFFLEVLEVSPETAEQDACMVEHDISPESLEKLLSYMQGEKGKGSSGPGLIDMVEDAIGEYLEKEKEKGEVKSYEFYFSDRYSPYSFTYERSDGKTVYALIKYESFEKEKVDIKCKMINFVLGDPERITELWYVRRIGEGRSISVSKTIGKRVREINRVLRESDRKLGDSGAAICCYKISLDIDSLDLEDIIEF